MGVARGYSITNGPRAPSRVRCLQTAANCPRLSAAVSAPRRHWPSAADCAGRKPVAAHALAALAPAASRDARGRHMSGALMRRWLSGIYADHRDRTRDESRRRFSCSAARRRPTRDARLRGACPAPYGRGRPVPARRGRPAHSEAGCELERSLAGGAGPGNSFLRVVVSSCRRLTAAAAVMTVNRIPICGRPRRHRKAPGATPSARWPSLQTTYSSHPTVYSSQIVR